MDSGRLTARLRSTGLYDNPPTLTAHIEQRPDGVTVTGQIRESFTDAMWQPAFLGLTIFMALLALFGVGTLITGHSAEGVPPLVIGALGAVAFFLLWRGARRNRSPNFDQQVHALEGGVRAALTTEAGSWASLSSPAQLPPVAPSAARASLAATSGFSDTAQGVLFYVAGLGCSAVVLFSLQAIVVGVTGTDIAYIAGGAAVAVTFGGTYRFRARRWRRLGGDV